MGEGNVIHGFRHSMRDRLRAVECPSDLIDQIEVGLEGVGEGYGYRIYLQSLSDRKIILDFFDIFGL